MQKHVRRLSGAAEADSLPAALRVSNADELISQFGGGTDSPPAELAALLLQVPAAAHEALWRMILDAAQAHLQLECGSLEQGANEVVHAVACALLAFVDSGAMDVWHNNTLPSSFVEIALRCHDLLLSVPSLVTQTMIARALEHICYGAFEDKEDFFGGVLMFLVGRCLASGTVAADVEHLYKARSLFAALDWEHASIQSMKVQLMRCVASPSFVRASHGPDMIAIFYTLPGFTNEVQNTVRNQVVYSHQGAMKAYAAGLFKALKVADEKNKAAVAECIQEWGIFAIRAERRSADKARAVLEEVHRNQHADDEVNALLCRIYAPILWRSLKVANWQVRENAARVLQYVVPLLPVELNVADREQELAKQLRLLREALSDPSESVRVAAVGAACVVLKNYWGMLPSGEIVELLTELVNKCSRDQKAPLVRAAVCDGFAVLLQNAESHPSMGAVLSQFSDFLNDRSPIVRAAFVNLLGKVSNCRAISTANIVNNEDLLVRISSEHLEEWSAGLPNCSEPTVWKRPVAEGVGGSQSVVQRLTKLMAPSLFGLDIAQQVVRCHFMVQRWPMALWALLSDIESVTPVADRVKLAVALFQFGCHEECGGSKEQQMVIAQLFCAVGVLLEGAVAALTRSKPKKHRGSGDRLPEQLENFIYEHLSDVICTQLLKRSVQEPECSSLRGGLLYLVSCLDPARLANTAHLVREELKAFCSGGGTTECSRSAQGAGVLFVGARWGLLDEAFALAVERLVRACERIRLRQPVEDNLANAMATAEYCLRDSGTRRFIATSGAADSCRFVQSFSGAMCNVLSSCLNESRTARAGSAVSILGQEQSDVCPRILGLAIRISLVLQLYGSTAPRSDTVVGDDQQQNHVEINTLLLETARSLLADPVLERLRSAEEAIASMTRVRKKARVQKTAPPPDIEAVIQLHERLLESVAAVDILGSSSAIVPADMTFPGESLEQSLWRWTAVQDSIGHAEGVSEADKDALLPVGRRQLITWASQARLLHHAVYGEASPKVIASRANTLLQRSTGDVPVDDADIKRVTQILVAALEKERDVDLPQWLCNLVEEASEKDVEGDPCEVMAPRVLKATKQLLPQHRRLLERLSPNELVSSHTDALVDASDAPGERCRVLDMPTPQHMRKSGAEDAISYSGSISHAAVRSNGKASRHSATSTLFAKCFSGQDCLPAESECAKHSASVGVTLQRKRLRVGHGP